LYLKALEIQGFKSFPDKTTLLFEKDVTMIVGPNGSGKSNISDAILWGMGEQRTRALRGGKMEDVIFGGTEKRSPLGFAQVTLVLDNTARLFPVDSDELAISRRYYRSGDSEYFINRESVRLRDINELLMDTGLGRDGYSIIGQGRIAEIVSAKSADRREIFEEAAGISRFRYRKEEAERKLASTDETLLRVGDKIEELEMQLAPLRKQAEVAEKYLKLRDELRLMEISVWAETLDKLAGQTASIRESYEKAKAELEQARTALSENYRRTETISDKMREKDLAPNRLVLTVQPQEGLTLELIAKKPGPKLCMGELAMDFRYSSILEPGETMPDAYERLLLDCMLGDQTLFLRSDTVRLAWKFLEPALLARGKAAPVSYPAGCLPEEIGKG